MRDPAIELLQKRQRQPGSAVAQRPFGVAQRVDLDCQRLGLGGRPRAGSTPQAVDVAVGGDRRKAKAAAAAAGGAGLGAGAAIGSVGCAGEITGAGGRAARRPAR